MLGRKELDKLNLQKQALLLESSLNRLALQAEFRNLRSATAWVSEVTRASRGLSPLLLLLAPVAGFLLARGSRQSDSWLGRVVAAVKWIGPLYSCGRVSPPVGKSRRKLEGPPPDTVAGPGLERDVVDGWLRWRSPPPGPGQ